MSTFQRNKIKCCPQGAAFIQLQFDYADEYPTVADFVRFVTTIVPQWKIMAEPIDKMSVGAWSLSKVVKCCPFCTAPVPNIKLRSDKIKKFFTFTDGYCCNTCGSRGGPCKCRRPEDLWEIAT